MRLLLQTEYSGLTASLSKTAEPIEMSFGLWIRVGSRNHVLDEGEHWRNLADVTEPSMCDGHAAFSQISLTTCYTLKRNICLAVSLLRGILIF